MTFSSGWRRPTPSRPAREKPDDAAAAPLRGGALEDIAPAVARGPARELRPLEFAELLQQTEAALGPRDLLFRSGHLTLVGEHLETTDPLPLTFRVGGEAAREGRARTVLDRRDLLRACSR